MCPSESWTARSLRKAWTPSAEAFQRFLVWLDEGAESNGERYLEMRRRLVAYFNRKRCRTPDDLADETLNRVARRLEEEGAISDAPPAHYCYIVARYVFLEDLRNADNRRAGIDRLENVAATVPSAAEDSSASERRLECLARCLDRLSEEDRELILAYYSGEERQRIASRRVLAQDWGLTANALTIRACRIRARLEGCVTECVGR